MASESALEEGSQVRISGKGIARGGVEAFVLIHLHNWLVSAALFVVTLRLLLIVTSLPQLNTESLGSETRDKLFRKITDNVWKSFLAAGHCIANATTCMVIPDREKKICSEWNGRVDQTFEAFWKAKGFKLWCDGMFATFAPWEEVISDFMSAFVPTAVPIVVAIVSYSDNEFHNAFSHIRDRSILALHRLNYESPQGYQFMVDRIY